MRALSQREPPRKKGNITMKKTTITFDAYEEGLTADERDQIYELLIQFGDNIEIEESEE